MYIENIILIGAGCPLADSIAENLFGKTNIIGISKRNFSCESYDQKLVFDFLSEKKSMSRLGELTNDMNSFTLITCIGGFPFRRKLSEYNSEEYRSTFDSNLLGFIAPYCATINNARQAESAMYITFGSVSQSYYYPKLGLYTAAKQALKAMVKTASHEEAKFNVKFLHLNLSTLDQEKEYSFTNTDAGCFLPLKEVADSITYFITGIDCAPYFSEVNLYKFSDSYYEEGYYKRIPKIK